VNHNLHHEALFYTLPKEEFSQYMTWGMLPEYFKMVSITIKFKYPNRDETTAFPLAVLNQFGLKSRDVIDTAIIDASKTLPFR